MFITPCHFFSVTRHNLLNDAENDTAKALGETGNTMSNISAGGEVRTRRVRQPRPKSAHFNIDREREFPPQGVPILTNGDLAPLQKDVPISSEAGTERNLNENDVLLRKLRAL